MKVVVGIPALDCWGYTKRTLDSIASKKHSLEIVVIDQGSRLKVLQEERRYAGVRGYVLIENGRNIGCAAAWNQVIEYGLKRAPYVCVANNDIVLREDTIDNLIDFWEHKPYPSIVNVGSTALEGKAGYSPESLKAYASKVPFTYGFSGPFFLFTEETKARGGLFDTAYSQGDGVYFEDNDYHWTLLEKGLLSVIVGSSVIFHSGSRTLHEALDRGKTQRIYDRNRQYFLNKHHTPTPDWSTLYEIVNGVVKRR